MSQLAETVAEHLGINREVAANVPEMIRKQAFFSRLSEHGYVARNDQEALVFLQASDVLEAKNASFEEALNPVNRATGILLGTRATGSVKQAGQPIEQERAASVNGYLEQYLQDPATYAALLTQVF